MSFWRIVKQASAPQSIVLSSYYEVADESGSFVNTLVTSSGAWDHDTGSVPAWISVSSGSGISGQYFEFTIDTNYSGPLRWCELTVWLTANHSVYANIYIEQAGL